MDLSWSNDSNKNIEFPVNYWKYVLNTYNQFAQGEHSVTKAYEHYLGFTDDYDFCWGPENEGDKLEGPEYNQRLWGVYTRTEGEIYLLKSNADLTGWEREELLTFAPSGSKKASISFDKEGHYEIACEITPAGGNPEIWVFSYPYEGDSIRKVFDGYNPIIFQGFNGERHIFYQPVGVTTQINYRSSDDDYSVEYVISATQSERDTEARDVIKFIKNGIGTIRFFYWRDDDIWPLKYIDALPFIFEEIHPKASIADITWIEIVETLKQITEETQIYAGIGTVTWEFHGIITIEQAEEEQTTINASVQDILWEQITKLTDEETEDPTVEVGIQDILWLIP